MFPEELGQTPGQASRPYQALRHSGTAYTELPLDQFADCQLLCDTLRGQYCAPVQLRGRVGDLVEEVGRDPVAQLYVVVVVTVAVEIHQKCCSTSLG